MIEVRTNMAAHHEEVVKNNRATRLLIAILHVKTIIIFSNHIITSVIINEQFTSCVFLISGILYRS